MSWLSSCWTEKSATSLMEGGKPLNGWQHVLDEIMACRLLWLGCKSYKCSVLHAMLMCTVVVSTERILNQARGASVPLYILAWTRGALSRHWTVSLYTKSESLYTSWCWPCGGPLQVTRCLAAAVSCRSVIAINFSWYDEYVIYCIL